ncbi:MAG TPA: hypothetical protein VHP11_13605 [Tepidisphaeraceae bacterium]|nr:hypothetical protein [Tepidisphaeraceae bacterium]
MSTNAGFSHPMALGGLGHPYRLVHGSGAQIFYGSARADQPIVVNVEGQVCEGWTDESLDWVCNLDGVVTRLDVAADVPPPELARRRLAQLRREWLRGRVKTRMDRKSHQWFGDDKTGGRTEVFGGKASTLRLRAYDVRGPLRLEWQWRPERESGRLVARTVKQMGPTAIWRSLADSAVWPMSWYQKMLEGDRPEWMRPESDESSLEQSQEALWKQWGTKLWALDELGFTLGDLMAPPEQRPVRGDTVAALLKWCDEAEKTGRDASKLRAKLIALQEPKV